MSVPHSVVVDDCAGALYVADRENSRVLHFPIGGDGVAHTELADLKRYGPVYAITAGPYGTLLALCWDRASDKSWIVEIDARDSTPPFPPLLLHAQVRNFCCPLSCRVSLRHLAHKRCAVSSGCRSIVIASCCSRICVVGGREAAHFTFKSCDTVSMSSNGLSMQGGV